MKSQYRWKGSGASSVSTLADVGQRFCPPPGKIENAVQGRLTVPQGAALLRLSERQVKRLKCNYDPADLAWVHHGNLAVSAGFTDSESAQASSY